MQRLFVILTFLVSTFTLCGQSNEIADSQTIDKKQLKIVRTSIRKADKLTAAKNPDYETALNYYNTVYSVVQENASLNYKIGKCKFYLGDNSAKRFLYSAFYLHDSLTTSAEQLYDNIFLLARSYQIDYELDSALLFYNKLTDNKFFDLYDTVVNKYKAQCTAGEKLLTNSLRCAIKTANDSLSDIMNNFGVRNFIMPTEILKSGDVVTDVSQNNVLLVCRKGNIFFSVKDEHGNWANLKKIKGCINSKYEESFACFSRDMKKIYFVSDRSGGFGGKDIYAADVISISPEEQIYCENCRNLGSNINSPYNEISLSFSLFDNFMYVCSDNECSIGGYDVFKSKFENDGWTKIENIGYPLNSSSNETYIRYFLRNDYFLLKRQTMAAETKLFSVELINVESLFLEENSDLPLLTLPPADDYFAFGCQDFIEINSYVMNTVSGKFLDADAKTPLTLKIDVVCNSTLQIIASFETHPKSGKFSISLPSGRSYGFVLHNDEYFFCPDEMIIPGTSVFMSHKFDFQLDKYAPDSLVLLKNISFVKETNHFNEDKSKGELLRLLLLLTDKPELIITIVGKPLYAVEIKNYLIDNGVDVSRILIEQCDISVECKDVYLRFSTQE
ncbi:MAG: hypothetical protein PHU62_03340 [Bacteroidales bacterium]|nr:hypothetical protein [Bacteroidales bacterium]MDD2204168.1 hypothetical protein [Bacteroidales bacterium]MDD3152523.1 hypothetical protein [Bacteroidales bacterium]MDD3914739.1 hypothetical protein [Bacteroidales bacterium]MDD4633597.1 hypothetical protein [Bacteroidales bacterium]